MEDTLLYAILSFIIFLFAFKFFTKAKTPYKNLPPGPPSLPIVGHLYLLKPPVHRTFHRLSQKYGPIFSLWFGSHRVVVVSSATAVHECFTKNDIVLANRPQLVRGKHVAYNYTTMVAAPYGDHWRNLRRIGSIEIFSASRLNMFLSIRKDEVKRLLFKLSQNSVQDFKRVEMKSMLLELTFNIIMRMVAGKRYYGDEVSDEEEARQFRELMKEIFETGGVSNPGDFLPILNWLGIDGFERSTKRLAKRSDQFLQGLIDEHRNSKESRNTMIDHLLSLQQSQPEYYTDKIIKGLMLYPRPRLCMNANRRPRLVIRKHLAYNKTTMIAAPNGDHCRNILRIGSIEIFSTSHLIRVEMKSLLSKLTFNIIMRMVAGKRYYGDEVSDEDEARRFRELVKEIAASGGASNPGDFSPILNWFAMGKRVETP
ncbi:hypothetical protein FEM48_Zijuj08G0125500 [Ziziphus jujuba var. spinosa]|uniref:Cytochrome P450 81E8-like n=1 Tax=Ziziphus jujuba var. spinosa TaxID=714518 RepID=A0A978UZ47_ZIZJJ|nr:hypothetical protein FEM48_Zijuj08G0125500 [Ziziphus jujuba var. spinosa]